MNLAKMPVPFEQLWKVQDVAKFLQMSASWVYKAAERGELPCVRFGANLRFLPEAVRTYVFGASTKTGANVSAGGQSEPTPLLTPAPRSDQKGANGIDP